MSVLFQLPGVQGTDELGKYFLLQNILDKFNPGARQLINAGKAYLKALHGEFSVF